MGIKISALTAVPNAQFTDIFPIVQGGVTYKETNTQLATLLGFSSGILGLSQGGTGANLVSSIGGIVYSGAGAFAILSGQLLLVKCYFQGLMHHQHGHHLLSQV